jgi:uncharacterized protein (TIGR00369 family)
MTGATTDPSGDAAVQLPEGFKALPTQPGFVGVNGPLYLRQTALADGKPRVEIGFRVEPRHVNPMHNCHGGMIATFCDMLLPLSLHRTSPEVGHRFLVTINLQIDYLAAAPLGAWVQGEAEVLRVTRTLVFAQGLVTADGVPAVRVSGIFKIGQPFTGNLEPIG